MIIGRLNSLSLTFVLCFHISLARPKMRNENQEYVKDKYAKDKYVKDKLPRNWQQFFRSMENKVEIFNFLTDGLQQAQQTKRIIETVLQSVIPEVESRRNWLYSWTYSAGRSQKHCNLERVRMDVVVIAIYLFSMSFRKWTWKIFGYRLVWENSLFTNLWLDLVTKCAVACCSSMPLRVSRSRGKGKK